MTIQKARVILGAESKNLSDSQLENLLKNMSIICDEILDLAMTASGSTLILKSDLPKQPLIH